MALMFPKSEEESKRKKQPRKMSILQDDKYCYVTYKRYGIKVGIGLELHHIFQGASKRPISDANGFWVYLLPEYHRWSEKAVHGRDGAELDMELKRDCQKAYERNGGKRDDFIRLVGKSYL